MSRKIEAGPGLAGDGPSDSGGWGAMSGPPT
jgi:hypothetical protein